MSDEMDLIDLASDITPGKLKKLKEGVVEWGKWFWGLIGQKPPERKLPLDSAETNEAGTVEPSSRILIAGRGGAGKSTLASLLSGDLDFLANPLGQYEPDLFPTSHVEAADASRIIDVLPGQIHRSTKNREYLQRVADGEYCGIIIVSSFGYHSLREIRYDGLKQQYGTTTKPDFLQKYIEEERHEELALLDFVLPYVQRSQRKRIWVLTVFSKMDLWYPQRDEVHAYYEGEYSNKLSKNLQSTGNLDLQIDWARASFIIRNFMVDTSTCLAQCSGGFDHPAQVRSILELFSLLNDLRKWEES